MPAQPTSSTSLHDAASRSVPGWLTKPGRLIASSQRRAGLGWEPPSIALAATLVSICGVLLVLSPTLRLGAASLRRVEPGLGDAIPKLFAIDGEKNVPTLVSTLILGVAGIACCGLVRKTWMWILPGLALIAMAADEALEIHEGLLDNVAASITIPELFAGSRWVVPGFVIAATLVALTILSGRIFGPRVRAGFVIGSATFFIGALGFETLTFIAEDSAVNGPIYTLLNIIEEGLEFLGAIIMLSTVINVYRPMTTKARLQ